MSATTPRTAWRSELGMIGLAMAVLTAGAVAGLGAATAPAILAVPVAGFLLAGRIAGRGAAVGCVVLALGATLIRPAPGAVPWMNLGVLAAMAATAAVVGLRLEAATAAPAAGSAAGGRWVTIVVEASGGPADACGMPARPRPSPRPHPERRSVVRLASERLPGRRPTVRA